MWRLLSEAPTSPEAVCDVVPPAQGPTARERLEPLLQMASERPPTWQARPAASAVLLVEDDSLVRNLVKRILEQGGYRVRVANDGSDALGILEQQPGAVGLVLTDIAMPGMDGLELVQQVQCQHPGLPVLLMSGASQARGAQHYPAPCISKPFSSSLLLRAVRARLAAVPACG